MEQVIYQDQLGNLISPSRAVIAGTTYPMQNISSVRMGVQEPPTLAAVGVGFFAVIFIIAQAWGFAVIFGLTTLAIATMRKRSWIVVLSTAGQERAALKSTKKEEIEAVVAALNKAIVAR